MVGPGAKLRHELLEIVQCLFVGKLCSGIQFIHIRDVEFRLGHAAHTQEDEGLVQVFVRTESATATR